MLYVIEHESSIKREKSCHYDSMDGPGGHMISEIN